VTTTPPVVHVIDDDASFRTAIGRVLKLAGYVVREHQSAGAFLLDTAARRGPGCILLDLRMPELSGLMLHEALAKVEDALPVIFISAHGDLESSVRALKAGAVDFLTKPVDRDTLLKAVGSAIVRDARNRTHRERRRELDARYATLLPREREILRYVAAGKLNKQIAEALGIAERTVKAHRAQVMVKMQAASMAELVFMAAQLRSESDASAAD
jgi:FixJ family two-component response regulator